MQNRITNAVLSVMMRLESIGIRINTVKGWPFTGAGPVTAPRYRSRGSEARRISIISVKNSHFVTEKEAKMYVTIDDFKGNSLSHAEKVLAGIPGGVEKAAKSALQRAASHVQTQSTKQIQERYALSSGAIRESGTVRLNYQIGAGLMATILFSGRKIPLHKYHGSGPLGPTVDPSRKIPVKVHGADGVHWIMTHPSIAARGHILRATGVKQFDNAFVAKVGNGGHVGIFERTGGTASTGNDRIREIMGLSNAQMVGNDEVREKLSELASKKFDERMEHEITRLLNGWGN